LLRRIAALDPALCSFITVTAGEALDAARAADARRARGEAGPLTGVPYANKDIFCTEGVKTSCGSRMLDNFIAPYDATVVTRLKAAGMVMLGKTNMDEFAMGSSNETSFHGACRNPWDLSRVPGGSSGGSAAAVAARLVPFATATDTGGSIRLPAAYCGVSGLKPTYGRVSRYGMVAFASSLDQGGPMALTAEDLAITLNAMAGFDPLDSTSVDEEAGDFTRHFGDKLQGLRIGLPREFFDDSLNPDVAQRIEEAIRVLESLGARCSEVALPTSAHAVPAYYIIASAECSSNLSRYDGVRFGYRCDNPQDLTDLYERSRAEGFGREVKRRILMGTYALSTGYYDAYYAKAQKLRRLIRDDFMRVFADVDVILGPTAPTVAFGVGQKSENPVEMYLSDIYTTAVNLAGLPGLSIPAGFVGGLPAGLQLIGKHFDEARLLGVAHAYQQATDWHQHAPAMET
jgi:aspartyl-tRNA(Asn)/glutamyl-tRNA(Gln) amidotransferase subunit A